MITGGQHLGYRLAPPDMGIQNDAVMLDGIAFAGTVAGPSRMKCDGEDVKIFAREQVWLRSLTHAQNTPMARWWLIHHPPTDGWIAQRVYGVVCMLK